MIFAEPDVDRIFGEVGGITAQECGLGVKGATGENPASVSPPGSIVRSVGVTFLVGVLMMDAVGGYPEDRTAFKCEASAHGDEVLDPLGSAIAAMGEQAVVGHADADVDREEVSDDKCSEIFPGEEEESDDGPDVEEPHGDGGDPVDTTLLMLTAHAEILLDLLGDFGDGRDHVGELWGGLYRGFFDSGDWSHVFSVSLYY